MSCGVAIFVKTPSLSPVKTRLWPGIGRRDAESLYLLSAGAVASVATQACIGGDPEPYWAVAEEGARHEGPWFGLPQLPQGDGSLGERMAHVYRLLRQRHHGAMLIGADAPQLTAEILRRAAEWLSHGGARLVIGRADDGGFWLFGGNASLPDHAWTDVRYSTPDTAMQFMQSMRESGQWLELETLCDIDTADDIPRVRAALATLQSPTPEQVRLRDWLGSRHDLAETST